MLVWLSGRAPVPYSGWVGSIPTTSSNGGYDMNRCKRAHAPMRIYVCNRKRCTNCHYPSCRATTDVRFAADPGLPMKVFEATGDLFQPGAFDGVV